MAAQKKKSGFLSRLRRGFHSIRYQMLSSYLLILILPYLLLGYGFLYIFDQMMVEESLQDLRQETVVLSANMEYTFGGIADVLSDFCSNSDVWPYFNHQFTHPEHSIETYYSLIRPTLTRYRALHPEIVKATQYTTNTTIAYNDSEIAQLKPGSLEEEIMQDLAASGELWTIRTVAKGDQRQVVAARILSLYQRPAGLFCVTLDEDCFLRLIGEERENSSVSLISHEGRVVLSTASSLVNRLARDTALQPVLDTGANDTAQITLDGQTHQAMRVTFGVENTAVKDWCLVRTVASEDLYYLANMNRTAVTLLGLLVMVVIIVLSIVFTNKLTSRLSKISAGIQAVEAGDFSVHIQDRGEDEVAQLAHSLNHMTRQLDRLVNENTEMKIRERESEMDAQESKLYALLSQINPHFIFNALEAVQYGIHAGLPETGHMVQLLARNMRRLASWSEDTIPLREELENIEEHLQIQQFRYGDKLRHVIQVEEELLTMEVPKIILQPLVENAVTHGVAMKSTGGTIWVRGYRKDGATLLEVEDDGAGMDEVTKEELWQTLHSPLYSGTRCIGLKNTYNRLLLFYGDAAEFTFDSNENQGTRIRITLRGCLHDASHDCG